jgi:hypothetical protein
MESDRRVTMEFLIGSIVIQFSLMEDRINGMIESLAKDDILLGYVGRLPLHQRLSILSELLDRGKIVAQKKKDIIAKIREYTQIRNKIVHTAPYHILDDGSEYLDVNTNSHPVNTIEQQEEFLRVLSALVLEVGHLSALVAFRDFIEPAPGAQEHP